jgi:hypothetical protein
MAATKKIAASCCGPAAGAAGRARHRLLLHTRWRCVRGPAVPAWACWAQCRPSRGGVWETAPLGGCPPGGWRNAGSSSRMDESGSVLPRPAIWSCGNVPPKPVHFLQDGWQFAGPVLLLTWCLVCQGPSSARARAPPPPCRHSEDPPSAGAPRLDVPEASTKPPAWCRMDMAGGWRGGRAACRVAGYGACRAAGWGGMPGGWHDGTTLALCTTLPPRCLHFSLSGQWAPLPTHLCCSGCVVQRQAHAAASARGCQCPPRQPLVGDGAVLAGTEQRLPRQRLGDALSGREDHFFFSTRRSFRWLFCWQSRLLSSSLSRTRQARRSKASNLCRSFNVSPSLRSLVRSVSMNFPTTLLVSPRAQRHESAGIGALARAAINASLRTLM